MKVKDSNGFIWNSQEYYAGRCIYCGVKVGQIGKPYSEVHKEGRTEMLCKKSDPRRFDPRGLK